MPAKTFHVTGVVATRVDGSETKAIPGMVVTVAELRAMALGGHQTPAAWSQVWCDACGESIADCEVIQRIVKNVPAHWSTRQGEADAWRHEDGPVAFD